MTKASRSAGAATWRHPRTIPRSVVVVLLGALLFAATAITLGWELSSKKSSELWFEVFKSGLQLAAVAILGGFVGWAYRSLDNRREAARRLDEYLAATASELWDTYHNVKTVRRRLRAAGFRGRSSALVSAEQAEQYRTQMDVLNDAQLVLEKLKREVQTQRQLFSQQATRIEGGLEAAEKYVGEILNGWESTDTEVTADRPMRNFLSGQKKLDAFVGSAQGPDAVNVLSEAVGEAAARIQSVRFGTEPDFSKVKRSGHALKEATENLPKEPHV